MHQAFPDHYRLSLPLPCTLGSPSGTYFAPSVGPKKTFVDYIKSLPYNESPEVFGLHANANMSCAISETNFLLNTALSLQPRSTGSGAKSWDSILSELAEDIVSRMPPIFDVERALLDFPVRYDEAMNTVLTQELMRFNALIMIISKSLVDLMKAIKGLVVMSCELEQMGDAMAMGKVKHERNSRNACRAASVARCILLHESTLHISTGTDESCFHPRKS